MSANTARRLFLIERRAAVMGDFVQCTGVLSAGIAHPPLLGAPPAFLPPPPFAPISKGSATVMINKIPAARWVVDNVACGTFVDFMPLAMTRRVTVG